MIDQRNKDLQKTILVEKIPLVNVNVKNNLSALYGYFMVM